MARQLAVLCFLSLVLAPDGAGAVERPLPVSPGGPAGGLIEARCPTFSWALVDGATSYELVTYTIEEDAEEPRVVLRRSLPGSASSWTPDLDRCLERGIEHAWSLRALGAKDTSGWSAASLFQVAAGPSEVKLERARALVERYLSESEFQAIPEGTFLRATSNMVLDVSQGTVESSGPMKTSGPAASHLSGPGMVINDQRVLRGWEKVEFTVDGDVILDPGVTLTVLAPHCPEGKTIVSGGVSTGGTGVRITESFPNSENDAWTTAIHNPGPGSATLTKFASFAICAQQ